jgi:hypothetical protein
MDRTSFSSSVAVLTSKGALDPAKLCCQILTWDLLGETPIPTFSQVILAAREFALNYPHQILVLPQIHQHLPRIWLIKSKHPEVDPDETGSKLKRLEERIAHHGLKTGKTLDEVDPEILEQSLQFCVQARMAPLWNRVKRTSWFTFSFVTKFFLGGKLFLPRPAVSPIKRNRCSQARTSPERSR